ncbi:MAG: glycosyltransferase family A protein [Gemmatimonadaceae bacterium]
MTETAPAQQAIASLASETDARKSRRTLRVGRGAQATDARVIDLRQYSHLSLFAASEAAAQYDDIIVTITEQDRDNVRPLLRDLDWMLAVGGTCEFRTTGLSASLEFTTHSILGRHCSIQTHGNVISCVKTSPNPSHATDNTRWSVAVMSNGNNEPRITRLIDSIARQNIPDVELLIVGPMPKLDMPSWCRHVSFTEHPRDARFEIPAKKNLVADVARHENLLILHDRYRLADNWYRAILATRSGWDALALPAVSEGRADVTLDDWVAFVPQVAGGREQYRLSAYQDTYPADFRHLDHVTLPYAQYSERMTINGGALAVKRTLFKQVLLDARLHWGEIEDADWTERLVNHGAVISLAHTAAVENLAGDAHGGAPKGIAAKVRAPYVAARLAARSALLRAVGSVAQRFGRRGDLFRSRGMFSNFIAPLSADTLLKLPAEPWPGRPDVFVRGGLEHRLDLRALLEQIRRRCPDGGGVYLELATGGVGYFTRGTDVRNCEVLMYEVSLVLGDDFELRSLFCSTELTFLVHLVRVRAPMPHVISTLIVIASDETWALRDDALLLELDTSYQRASGSVAAVPGDGTVLLLRNARTLGNARHWHSAYAAAGFVAQRAVNQGSAPQVGAPQVGAPQVGAPQVGAPYNRLLDGNVMCSRQQWAELLGGRDFDLSNWCDSQRAEVTAILRGRWPAQLHPDGSFE